MAPVGVADLAELVDVEGRDDWMSPRRDGGAQGLVESATEQGAVGQTGHGIEVVEELHLVGLPLGAKREGQRGGHVLEQPQLFLPHQLAVA